MSKEILQMISELKRSTLSSYVKKAEKDKSSQEKLSAKKDDEQNRLYDRAAVAQEKRRSQAQSGKGSGRIQSDQEVKLRGKASRAYSDKLIADIKAKRRAKGIEKATSRLTAEDLETMSDDDFDSLVENFEQLDELSRKTLAMYVAHAASDARNKTASAAYQGNEAKYHKSVGNSQVAKDIEKSAKATDNKASKRMSGVFSAAARLATNSKVTKEETEQIEELSKSTLSKYNQKATEDGYDHSRKALDAFADGDKDKDDYHWKKMDKRFQGKAKAMDKLKKMGVNMNEASVLGAGMSKAARAADVEQSDREYIVQRQKRDKMKSDFPKDAEVIVKTHSGEKHGIVNDVTRTHIGVKHKGISGVIHYHPEYVKRKVEESIDETLIEGVDWSRWERSHSGSKEVKKSNRGSWMVSKHSDGYRYGHKEGEDHITVNGTGKEAAQAGQKWAKEKGHNTVYMLEAFTPDAKTPDFTMSSIVKSALTTARKP